LFDIGGNLAAARKGQGLAPSDVKRLTLLRGSYLAALERNEFDALPGRVYARAFLRTYADALGLDADRFVEVFDARYPEPDDEPPPAVIRPQRAFRLRPRIAVTVAVAVVAVGPVAWSTLTSSPRLPPDVRRPVAKVPLAHTRAALVLPAKIAP